MRVESNLSEILTVGPRPILKPNDPPQEVVETIDEESFLSPPWVLPDSHFKEIYAPYVLNRVLDPRPVLTELYRVARPGCLLELTMPHGGCDAAWEDPRFVRPWFPNSFVQFSRPLMRTAQEYDWQAKVVYVRVPDALLAQMPEESHFQGTMIQRNVGQEICCVLEAIKPARKADNPEKIRMPKILVQPWSARVAKTSSDS